jgi:methyl-accepting chemotaxis protein
MELTVAVILVGFGFQLPNTEEVHQTFKRVEAVATNSGNQVRMLRSEISDLRRPELQDLAAGLRRQTRLVTDNLKGQQIDYEQVQVITHALGDVATGLDDFSQTLDAKGVAKLGEGLGATADFLDQKVAPSAGRASDHLEQTTVALQKDAKALSSLLREAPPDLSTAREIYDGLGRFNQGLEKMSGNIGIKRLATMRDGFRGLDTALSTGADQVERLSDFRYPVVRLAGLRPEIEQRKFWPEGEEIADGLRKAADGVRAAGKEMDDMAAELPKIKATLDESCKMADKTREALGTALKQQDKVEKLLKDVPEQTARLADELPKVTGELSRILRETEKLKEIAGMLRQAQKTLDRSVSQWPDLRVTLGNSATLLRATQKQLYETLSHRQEFESSLKQTVVLADSFSSLLPLYTQQLDGQLKEQERALGDLSTSIDEVGSALPPCAQTASQLVQTGRLLIWLVAAIMGLHGGYLALSARLGKQFSM